MRKTWCKTISKDSAIGRCYRIVHRIGRRDQLTLVEILSDGLEMLWLLSMRNKVGSPEGKKIEEPLPSRCTRNFFNKKHKNRTRSSASVSIISFLQLS